MRYYLFALLFVTTLTPVLAQSTQQDLLYSADISSGEKRLYGDVTVSGVFSPEKISDFGTVWKIDAGKFMELHFSLPAVEKVENCRLKVREFGMPREQEIELDSILTVNGSFQRLDVAKLQKSQTRFYDLAPKKLRVGDKNVLKISGIEHDLGIQSLEIHCKAPLPTAKMDEAANEPAITLLAPIADQYISVFEPLDIKWTTANLPEHARLDIDYLAKNGDWQTIDKGIPYNHPTNTGKRGFYRWEKLPTDVNPQLQVRLRYDTEQSAAGKIWIEKTTGINFIYIPPGCFQIGSKENESGHQKNEPQTRVCVESFWMGKTEVTNKQYRFRENAHDSGEGFNHDEQPVVNVSRSQANKFSQWLSQQTGKQFRLPTEAEWEYAARAGQTTAYPWGDDPNEACQFANVKGKRLAHNCKDNHAITAPVAQFDTNAFQLHDMIGNVAEWTCSTLNKSYTKANTCGNFKKEVAVIRGGSWGQSGDDIRFAKRIWYLDSQQIGFRLVREAKSN